MPPKGELETVYGSPWGGVDYSRPYNVLDPQFLAPGSVNTSQINGFLTSSPWVGSLFNTGANEFVIGSFKSSLTGIQGGVNYAGSALLHGIVVVTNKAVYASAYGIGVPGYNPPQLINVHTWSGGETNPIFMTPGNAVAFVQVGQTIFLTGLMLNGIFQMSLTNVFSALTFTFSTATTYVCAANLFELDGYLVAAQCIFPTGGGTGTGVLPTIAWSGPGEYAGSGASDPWNPVNGFGGGFNELSDVPDQITGIMNIGRSAAIFRQSGISQMDPNPGTANSGLEPFTFYHLWSSAQGVGAFLGTVAQFGQQGIFRSSDNIYSLSISGGLQAVGPRIMPKILGDFRAAMNSANYFQNAPMFTPWYFAGIVTVAGQLHYLLTFSSVTLSPPYPSDTLAYTSLVYDYNVSENAWHVWDMQKYLGITGQGQQFLGFSCPPLDVQVTELSEPNSSATQLAVSDPPFTIFGAFTSYGTVAAAGPLGNLLMLVPFDYGFNSNYTAGYTASLYNVLTMPVTTITLRGEVISLGHKISTRRLRIQADNAPLPIVVSGAQQQALVTFTGALQGNVKTAPVQQTVQNGSIQPWMQGNYPHQGAPTQTYYGDVVLSDEMIQPSISSVIADPANPWFSLPAFRIATLSLIAMDATPSTQ